MENNNSVNVGKEHSSGQRAESLVSQEQGLQPTEATPRPWRLDHSISFIHVHAERPSNSKIGNDLNPIATVRRYNIDGDYSEGDSNAELIVRAVNAHDVLVAALRNFLLWEHSTPADTPPYGHDCRWCVQCVSRVRADARAALALATKPDSSAGSRRQQP